MSIHAYLDDLVAAADRIGNPGAVWAVYAVSRYVTSGNASVALCAALRRANPYTLVWRLLNSGNGSEAALVSVLQIPGGLNHSVERVGQRGIECPTL